MNIIKTTGLADSTLRYLRDYNYIHISDGKRKQSNNRWSMPKSFLSYILGFLSAYYIIQSIH